MAAETPAPDELDDLISQTLGELDEEPKAPEAAADPKAAASDLKACVDELKAPDEPNQEEMLMNMLSQFAKPEFRQQMEQALGGLGDADGGAQVPPVAGAGYPAAGAGAGAKADKQVQGPKTQAEQQEWDSVAKQLDGMVEKARNEMQVDQNMHALIEKFEVYMKENAEKLEPSERERYAKQLTIYKRIEELSKGKDDQQTPELFTLLGQLHALGDPPKEIATPEEGGGAGGPDLTDEEMKQQMEFLGKMAEYGQQGEAGIEKLVTEMAPEMDKMMEELLKNAPPDAQKAAEQVSEECKQQ